MTTDLAVRPARVAGSFYPGSAGDLGGMVEELLDAARRGVPRAAPPGGAPSSDLAGLIVPHAGYAFSGRVAAAGYARLAWQRPAPSHLAVLGPAHFVARRGAAVPTVTAWDTPLGPVAIDPALRAAAVEAGAWLDDRPHEAEHAVEVQLPFISVVCPGVPVLPVTVSDIAADAVADLIDALAALPGTVIVVSTDLSHYLDDARARAVDGRTAASIEAREEGRIGLDDACGAYALRGVVRWSARRGLSVRRLALATSADSAGGTDRVVGYGAFAIEHGAGWSVRAAGARRP
jgi:hypothetical protein